MSFLLEKMEKSKHHFEPGGKLEKLYPLHEVADTFLFTPEDVTDGSPHIRDAVDLKRVMIAVVIALIPAILFGIYNAGRQYYTANLLTGGAVDFVLRGLIIVMPIILVSYAVGGFWEVLFSIVRKHEINEGFLVTGLLFPLTLPPTIPLWQVAVGISFGVVIGKEIFGGTGFNVLNPALTARAFLFFAYPGQISGDKVWTVLRSGGDVAEGFTGATPLAVAAAVPRGESVVEALNQAGFTMGTMFSGLEGGSIAETAVIPSILGALILVLAGVGAWRIMIGGGIGLMLMGLLMNALSGEATIGFTQLPFYYHFVMGGFLFGMVFMATDPVSAAATNTGKWIYGFMIGALVVLIRVANPAYPEGAMLAILFMNVMAPVVDHYVVQSHIRKRQNYVRKFTYANG